MSGKKNSTRTVSDIKGKGRKGKYIVGVKYFGINS